MNTKGTNEQNTQKTCHLFKDKNDLISFSFSTETFFLPFFVQTSTRPRHQVFTQTIPRVTVCRTEPYGTLTMHPSKRNSTGSLNTRHCIIIRTKLKKKFFPGNEHVFTKRSRWLLWAEIIKRSFNRSLEQCPHVWSCWSSVDTRFAHRQTIAYFLLCSELSKLTNACLLDATETVTVINASSSAPYKGCQTNTANHN